METELSYCDLTNADDYPASNAYLFQDVIFASDNLHSYAYEHSVNPRDDGSFKKTPNGKFWGNIWNEIDNNQNRKAGKRRNRYHISWRKRIIKKGTPATFESVTTCDLKVNPLDPEGPTLKWTKVEEKQVTEKTEDIYAPVNLIYFDIDDMDAIDAFKNLPSAIWARSPSGKCHVFVLIKPSDYERAQKRVAEWMYYNNVKEENNIVRMPKSILSTILIPGQDEWTLPCKPGEPEVPIASNYQETVNLFCEHYRNNSLDVDEAFPVKSQIKQKPIVEPEIIPEPEITKPTVCVPKRNRPRLGGKCNLPVIAGPISITRDKGRISQETFTYTNINDCIEETNGYHISWSYFAALVRHHQGDMQAAYNDYVTNRQSLRTLTSKKHNSTLLKQNARAMMRYAEKTYDPEKLKNSNRDREDRIAMASVIQIPAKHYTQAAQKTLRLHREEIIKNYGEPVYQTTQAIIPEVTANIEQYLGRLAQRSKKTKDGYTYADSNAMLDYSAINGNKRLLNRVIHVLKSYILDIDDVHNWAEAKCTRYTYKIKVANKAQEEYNKTPNPLRFGCASNNQNRILSLTNVGPQMPREVEFDYSENSVFDILDDIMDDITEKQGQST